MLVKRISDIRNFLKQLFSLKVDVRYETRVFTEVGDFALFTVKWNILNEITMPCDAQCELFGPYHRVPQTAGRRLAHRGR